MAGEQFMRKVASLLTAVFASPNRHTVASYSDELTRIGLRVALAREEPLRRESDAVISMLFAGREFAANYIARLTPRERQIMELVLAGYPSKNIAADLGISQRTGEPSRHGDAQDQHEVASGVDPIGTCRSWSGAAEPPSSAELRNMGEPDRELITSTAR
jgi:hypothetical protein